MTGLDCGGRQQIAAKAAVGGMFSEESKDCRHLRAVTRNSPDLDTHRAEQLPERLSTAGAVASKAARVLFGSGRDADPDLVVQPHHTTAMDAQTAVRSPMEAKLHAEITGT